MNSHFLDKWDAVHAWCHRWRWWRRLALAIVILPWFGRFAYVRMTTLPANTGMASWTPLQTLNLEGQTKALVDAIPGPISVVIPAPTTAPAGMQWVPTSGVDASPTAIHNLDPYQAAYGAWTPQKRHHLAEVITWVENPATEASLTQITALASQPFRLDVPGLEMRPWSSFRQACKLLCVHARYSMAEKHDLKTANRDIGAMFHLCQKLEDDGTLIRLLVAIACRNLAYEELTCWAKEFRFTRNEAQEVIAVLESHRLDLAVQWPMTLRAESRWSENMLDGFYTCGPDGNGWLVVARWDPQSTDTKILSVLNLLSPLVADRQTLARVSKEAIEKAIQAATLPYKQAILCLGGTRRDEAEEWKLPENPMLGPSEVAPSCHPVDARLYEILNRSKASYAAAITSLATNAYRNEHGHYPEHLSVLVPEYLKALPLDPVSREPLRYRLDDQAGFLVYGVGKNSVDDGGQIWKESAGKRELWRDYDAPDWTFPGIRNEPDTEWFLVPATQPAGGGDNASAQ